MPVPDCSGLPLSGPTYAEVIPCIANYFSESFLKKGLTSCIGAAEKNGGRVYGLFSCV